MDFFDKFALYGLLGALIPDLIRLAKERHEPLQAYLQSLRFWIGLFAQVIIGIIAVALGDPDTAVKAVAFGYAGPEFITRVLGAASAPQAAATAGATVPGQAGPESEFAPESKSLLQWWST